MWGKLQTHGDKKNDAEVLAIAAAGAPLDVMAMFFESHIEELPDLCVEKLVEAVDKRASDTPCHRESENWKDLQLGQELNLKGEKAMDGFVKTLGVLMVLAAVALWAALIFFVPAALIKFLWLYLVA